MNLILGLFMSGIVFAHPGDAIETDFFTKLADRLIPSVVNISSVSKQKPGAHDGSDEFLKKFFDEFFGGGMGPGLPRLPGGGGRAMALGSGFVVDSSGVILTNNHVVADADDIKVTLSEGSDEKPFPAEVVGRDAELDIALIRLKKPPPRKLVPMALGDSDKVSIGEFVMVIGNPFGQGHSVTHGIISQKGRVAPDIPLAKYLQTDAPINPGNSGGPLVNLKGEVIGVSNAIEARAHGIGFAIPVNVIKNVLPQLLRKGSVSRGFIGVAVEDLEPEAAEKLSIPRDLRAPVVVEVSEPGPASRAGLKPLDVVIAFGGKPVHSNAELVNAVTGTPVGTAVPLKISRDGKEQVLNLIVGQRKDTEEIAPGKKQANRKPAKEVGPPETGMRLHDVNREIAEELEIPVSTQGAVVTSIDFTGPAASAGIMPGDIIVEVDRKPVATTEDFTSRVKERSEYVLRIRRPHLPNEEQERHRGQYRGAILDLRDS